MTSNTRKIDEAIRLVKEDFWRECVFCGHVPTEGDPQKKPEIHGAHVVPRTEYALSADTDNIIPLCGYHHSMFDRIYTHKNRVEEVLLHTHTSYREVMRERMDRLSEEIKRNGIT